MMHKFYEVKQLAYPYDALEPHSDQPTMELHHGRHLSAYVANLNALIEKLELKDLPTNLEDFPTIVAKLEIDDEDRRRLLFNAGGVVNHDFYFAVLGPLADPLPMGELAEAMAASFGNFTNFQKAFRESALRLLGSGWTWLCYPMEEEDPANSSDSLFICNTSNHDNPLMTSIPSKRGQPILCLDLWEHAYYLKYQNRKGEFIDTFWSVIDWSKVGENYRIAKAGYPTLGLT
jgi:Fe-Mn family superoxide dismutase